MDKVLKQRLIGATILIALAVIFVPMLFEAPDERPARELTIDLPDAPADRAPIRRLPLDPDQARRVSPESVAEAPPPVRVEPPPLVQPPQLTRAPADRDPADDSSVVESAAALAEETVMSAEPVISAPSLPDPDPRPAPVPETIIQEDERDSGPGLMRASAWMVQVASFGAQSSAAEVVERLGRLGHVAAIDPLIRGETTLYRVVTGPYSAREDAERARGQIAATVAGVEPILREGPVPAVMATSALASETAFAVQVGSFASRNNAVRLRDQLQSHELPAFLHQDQAGSRTIWRVRVGPVASRAEAEALLARVVERMSLEGLVVSHP